jgi:hypothetical protein
MGRGLYNQKEGNENRQSSLVLEDRCSDNAVVEGKEEATLRRMIQDKAWQQVEIFVSKLKGQGSCGIKL